MNIDRRKFINLLSRNLLLAGLIGGSAYLLLKEKTTDESCNFDFVCNKCKQLKKCALPVAIAYKKKNPSHNNIRQ